MTPEFRRQMVELHRSGHLFIELAEQFGCTSWSIRVLVKQADRDRRLPRQGHSAEV